MLLVDSRAIFRCSSIRFPVQKDLSLALLKRLQRLERAQPVEDRGGETLALRIRHARLSVGECDQTLALE